jgi:AcrR family transcriptional regulator
VEAAAAIIAEQGLQNLSLSEIEKRAGMSRGQLTYYFPSKESILLAVFDHLLQMTYQRIGTPPGTDCAKMSGWDWVHHLLDRIISQGPVNADFHALQYTFLSQISHREDFRKRLASLYEEWRTNLAAGLAKDADRSSSDPSPRAIASIVQALLHGLAMQAAADPEAFDRHEMFDVCVRMLSQCVRQNGPAHNGDSKRAPAVRPGRSETVR